MLNELRYLELLNLILSNNRKTDDRTGTGTVSYFGHQMRLNLRETFPLLTTKKVFWKGVVIELLWMLRGETNTKFLHKYDVKIWDAWQRENGNLGPVYGKQMRAWTGRNEKLSEEFGENLLSDYDQIENVISQIKTNPTSRRLIVNMWNVADLEEMALPPCPTMFQFEVYDGELSCHLYQRSADVFLGVPFDMASYSLLTHLIANECGLKVGDFIHSFGNVHIYNNHLDQVHEQMTRAPMPAPTVKINIKPGELLKFIDECDQYSWETIATMIELKDYKSHAGIKAEVAV